MKRLPVPAWLAAMAALLFRRRRRRSIARHTKRLVATHAKANNVPEALVHRVIVRESKYHPDLVGRGGTIGLMQIKLATARGLGYTGDADGLRDPETNLTYGVKYLAGAYRAAEGDHDRAMHYYASGYYEVAKHQRLERLKHPEPVVANASPQEEAKPAEPAPADGKRSGCGGQRSTERCRKAGGSPRKAGGRKAEKARTETRRRETAGSVRPPA